jgi:hypothetical protein
VRLKVDPTTGTIDVQTRREKQKRDYDVRTRVLVGARLRREEVDRYRHQAELEGKSMYAWVRDTLREAVP